MERSVDAKAEEARRTTVATALALLQGKLGVVEAARRLSSLRFALVGDELDEDWRVFVGIDSETDHLPLGDVRKHWAAYALAEKDAERERCDEFYRSRALNATQALMRRYEQNG